MAAAGLARYARRQITDQGDRLVVNSEPGYGFTQLDHLRHQLKQEKVPEAHWSSCISLVQTTVIAQKDAVMAQMAQMMAKKDAVMAKIMEQTDALHKDFTNTRVKLSQSETVAAERYKELAILEGKVYLRDHLKEVENDIKFEFQLPKHTLRSELWEQAFVARPKLRQCAKDYGQSKTPQEAAKNVVRIMENLNKQMHQHQDSLEALRSGGVTVLESEMLTMGDCYLVACIFREYSVPFTLKVKQRAGGSKSDDGARAKTL